MPPRKPRPRRAVYTALIGGYEKLRERESVVDSDVDFVCFTDDPSLVSTTWRVELIDVSFPMDSVRSARVLKTIGHPLLNQYEETIWVDNRVSLLGDPHAAFDELLADCDLFIFVHSFRDIVIDEFEAVVAGGYDDPGRVYEQLLHYSEIAPEVLNERALWTGFLPRRMTPEVRHISEVWHQQILRYSRRDQLSINVALHGTSARVTRFEHDNRASKWHEWPLRDAGLQRTPGRGHRFERSIRAPLASLRAVGPVRDDLLLAHQRSAEARDATIAKLRADSEALRKALTTSDQQRRRAEGALDAIMQSRSYKLARKLATARSFLRPR
jgi:hypothetical protein